MVPDYRHASPPPLPDGHAVPQPGRPLQPAVTRRQYVYGLLCAAIVLALTLVGLAR